MADPVTATPEEARSPAPLPRHDVRSLLRRPGFRRVYLAVATSELGDAFQYIALMWAALLAGGPLGAMAVRLADSVPALVFGFHGGLLADRAGRKRLMVAADLVRAAALVPVAVAGLTGSLPLWALVVAAFVLTTCASYFDPAYGAVLPARSSPSTSAMPLPPPRLAPVTSATLPFSLCSAHRVPVLSRATP